MKAVELDVTYHQCLMIKITDLDSATVNRNPILDKDLANEKNVDDSI